MRISERESARRLEALCGLTRTPARRLLRTGIAGVSFWSNDVHALLYDTDRVEAVGRRAMPTVQALRGAVPAGLLHLRLAPAQRWEVGWDSERRLEVLADHAPIARIRRLELLLRLEALGLLPLVATVSGFVIGGAEVCSPGIQGRRLVLDPPGAWFGVLDGRPWPSSRGGLALQWHDAAPWRLPDRMSA